MRLNAQFNQDDWHQSRMLVFPTTTVINSNSVFLLKEVPCIDEIIPDLNKKYPVYLKSAEENIPLSVIEIHKHRALPTHAVLKPSALLKAGMEYELIIDSLSAGQKANLFCQPTVAPCGKIYKVTDVSDTTPPMVIGKPWLIVKFYSLWSCSRISGAFFCISTKDTTDFLVKTTIKHSKYDFEYIRYIQPESDNKVFIGKGNCYPFKESKSFQKVWVKFSLMDASGNIVVCNEEFIKFRMPRHFTTGSEKQKLYNAKCKICQ